MSNLSPPWSPGSFSYKRFGRSIVVSNAKNAEENEDNPFPKPFS